ncbi:hypothetical protein [Rhizobium leguminosarum]
MENGDFAVNGNGRAQTSEFRGTDNVHKFARRDVRLSKDGKEKLLAATQGLFAKMLEIPAEA